MVVAAALLVAFGQQYIRRGWDARFRPSPPGSTPAQQEVLTQEQESLLRAIDDLQVRLTLNKVVISRNGDVLTPEDKVKQTGVNLVRQLFGEAPPGSEGTHARFVALIESVPTRYLRFFSETRMGNPLVVSVTDEGRRYLRR